MSRDLTPGEQDILDDRRRDEQAEFDSIPCCPVCSKPNRDEEEERLEHFPHCSKACSDAEDRQAYEAMCQSEREAAADLDRACWELDSPGYDTVPTEGDGEDW